MTLLSPRLLISPSRCLTHLRPHIGPAPSRPPRIVSPPHAVTLTLAPASTPRCPTHFHPHIALALSCPLTPSLLVLTSTSRRQPHTLLSHKYTRHRAVSPTFSHIAPHHIAHPHPHIPLMPSITQARRRPPSCALTLVPSCPPSFSVFTSPSLHHLPTPLSLVLSRTSSPHIPSHCPSTTGCVPQVWTPKWHRRTARVRRLVMK